MTAPRPARFLDVGLLDPADFHATYAGVAEAAAAGAQPVLVWGRARTHISIGQTQSRRAELEEGIAVPVIRRPLGGGTVWVDQDQYCHVIVVPRDSAPRSPADWPAWGLAPAIAVLRRFGLEAAQHADDIWIGARKIAGSGSATLGRSAVFASSFLLRFPRERFAACVAAPSPGFNGWLAGALHHTMTDWREHQPVPTEAALRAAFREAITTVFGWTLASSTLTAAEAAARDDAKHELHADTESVGSRRVAGGIKLNAGASLVEVAGERVLTIGGQVVRRMRLGAAAPDAHRLAAS